MSLVRHIVLPYTHTQSEPSDTWVITHNQGVYPIVDIFIDVGGQTQKIIPLEVQYTDKNTCTVLFSTAKSGHAVIS